RWGGAARAGPAAGRARGFLLSAQVDPPEAVLEAAPVPYWRAVAVRLACWLVPALAAVLGLTWLAGARAGAAGAWYAAVPPFLLVSAVCLLAASVHTSTAAAGTGVAVLVALAMTS